MYDTPMMLIHCCPPWSTLSHSLSWQNTQEKKCTAANLSFWFLCLQLTRHTPGPPLTCKKVQFFSSTLNFWYFKRNLSASETQISKNIFPPQFEISQFFPETKPSSSLVWTTCKEVALQQICLFAGFWFLSLHLTLSWSLNSPRSSCKESCTAAN